MAGLISNSSNFSSNGMMAINYQLENFASAPVRRMQQTNVLAVCFADEAAKGSQCYVYSTCKRWRAEDSGGPDIPINDCAMKLTGLSGSRACEQTRQVGVSEEETTLFVKDMKQFRPSTIEDTGHPTVLKKDNRLEMNEDKLKDVKIDARLTITSTDSKMNTWFGFVSEGALFLRGNGWDDMDIRESVVAALDLAEEQLGCQTVHLCLEKSDPNIAKLVRTLMYAGFEMVHPAVLPNANPKYLVMGMDL